jgi:drug/metabolite transporter (DMT)-like permease
MQDQVTNKRDTDNIYNYIIVYLYMNYKAIILSLFASLCIGLHIFSIKYIQLKREYSSKIIGLVFASFSLWVLSRIFLFWSFQYTNGSTFVHLFLTSSILVSIYLDRVILNKPIVDPWVYFGIGLILLGYFIIIYKFY